MFTCFHLNYFLIAINFNQKIYLGTTYISMKINQNFMPPSHTKNTNRFLYIINNIFKTYDCNTEKIRVGSIILFKMGFVGVSKDYFQNE